MRKKTSTIVTISMLWDELIRRQEKGLYAPLISIKSLEDNKVELTPGNRRSVTGKKYSMQITGLMSFLEAQPGHCNKAPRIIAKQTRGYITLYYPS